MSDSIDTANELVEETKLGHTPHYDAPHKGSVRRNFNVRASVDGYKTKQTFSSDGGYFMELFTRNAKGKRIVAYTIIASEVESNNGNLTVQVFRGKPKGQAPLSETLTTSEGLKLD
jgi:hypothetical protein